MVKKYITKSFSETQEVGAKFARQILRKKPAKQAVVLALSGDLGAGKTTFLQGFAKGLGINEVVNSPTFVVVKSFSISQDSSLRAAQRRGAARRGNPEFKKFYHVDLHRLENEKDLEFLNFPEIISNPENIVAIEWPEKISEILPKSSASINFKHLEENKRELIIKK